MAVQDTMLQPELASGRRPPIIRAKDAVIGGIALILRTNTGRVAFAIVLIHLIVAILGPWITPYPPTEYDLPNRFSGPSAEHWLGTDDKGRDVLSRVLAGSRSIVWIAVVGTVLGVTLGTIVGVTSGYFGGKTDQVIMRFVDWFLAIPSLLLAILVINMSRQRFSDLDESWLVILTIGISFMPNNSRVIRSAALAIKPLEFVQSARLRGEPTLVHHVPRDTAELAAGSRGGSVYTAELRVAAHGGTGLPWAWSAAALIRLGLDGERELPPYKSSAACRAFARLGDGVLGRGHKPACGRHKASPEPARNRRLAE